MNDHKTTINDIKSVIQQFMDVRDWGQFHSPKNLSMSIAIEAAELMEHFQWAENSTSAQELEKNRTEIEHEIADIAILLIRFCQKYDIDLAQAIETKMALNAQKYPVDKSKGKSTKYTKL